MLPIFASLCGNDYLIMNEYPEFEKQLSHYSSIHNRDNNHQISNKSFKSVIDFLLDITDAIKDNHQKFENFQQDLFIEEILKRKVKENDPKLDLTFKNNLIYSINEYNLLNTNKIDATKFMISQDIIKSIQSKNLLVKLLNSKYIYIYFFYLFI